MTLTVFVAFFVTIMKGSTFGVPSFVAPLTSLQYDITSNVNLNQLVKAVSAGFLLGFSIAKVLFFPFYVLFQGVSPVVQW